jgi:hypothetical protein
MFEMCYNLKKLHKWLVSKSKIYIYTYRTINLGLLINGKNNMNMCIILSGLHTQKLSSIFKRRL